MNIDALCHYFGNEKLGTEQKNGIAVPVNTLNSIRREGKEFSFEMGMVVPNDVPQFVGRTEAAVLAARPGRCMRERAKRTVFK